MPRPITAILIDPYAGTVTEVEHDADDCQHIYKLLSGEPHDVDTMTAAYPEDLQPSDAIFVDDNGLLSRDERRRPFLWEGYGQPLMGRGLIVGSDSNGDTIAPKITLAEAQARVKFAPPCFKPKLTSDDRQEARDAVIKLATTANDDEFDELGQVLALGIEVERLLDGIDGAMEVAVKLGASTAVAVSELSHRGHKYHVRVERCPNCEQAEEKGAE